MIAMIMLPMEGYKEHPPLTSQHSPGVAVISLTMRQYWEGK